VEVKVGVDVDVVVDDLTDLGGIIYFYISSSFIK
jgi:hypothetical protein